MDVCVLAEMECYYVTHHLQLIKTDGASFFLVNFKKLSQILLLKLW